MQNQCPQRELSTTFGRAQTDILSPINFISAIERLLLAILLCVMATVSSVAAAENNPWEYDPYRIHCWIAIDPGIGWTQAEEQFVIDQVFDSIDLRFGAAATVSAETAPRDLAGDILYDLEGLSIERLLGRELVIATSRQHPQGKEARTKEAAIEKFDEVLINAANFQIFKQQLESSATEGKEDANIFEEFAKRLKPYDSPTANADGLDPVAVALQKGEFPIAVISRAYATANKKLIQATPLIYPWHMQSVLNEYDKIYAIALKRCDLGVRIELREIDGLLRMVGPKQSQLILYDAMVGARIGDLVLETFTPFVRIETAEGPTAIVRVRAGGLLPGKDHPCYIGPGDVLRPIYRRDKINGEPSLIQYLPWTFIVGYQEQDSKLECAIVTGIRNPLGGRPNRRLHKLATLVKPRYEQTELKFRAFGNPDKIVPGCAVFRRTPGTEELDLVGRSDWRGIITITKSEPSTIIYERPVKTDSKPEEAAVASTPVTTDANADQATKTEDGKPAETPPAPAASDEPQVEKIPITLKLPLNFYFVKSGNRLLARLPVVTGLEQLQYSDLPDDSKRLEAEAFVKAIESQIIDTVARRQLLKRRIEEALNNAKIEDAKNLLNELKAVKDYTQFREELNAIQQRILQNNSASSASAQRSIDKMFESAGESMQKFLQDSIVRDMEVAIINYENGEPASDEAAPAADDAGTEDAETPAP